MVSISSHSWRIDRKGDYLKTILVTGGSGFIGSYFIKYIFDKYSNYRIINIDLLTYAGNPKNLEEVSNYDRYTFIHGDISDALLIEDVFSRYSVDYIVNFAAESHVDRSIISANDFIKTNIVGTYVLVDAARKFWSKDIESRFYRDKVKFVQVSTDEVYGSLGMSGYFTENSPLSPNSPYAATKASADMIVQSYFKTYGFPCNITRCSNNYGPNQNPEKLIPKAITNAIKDEAIPIYANGEQIRDWIHVSDHCKAIDLVLHAGKTGDVYNIGASMEVKNLDLVKFILKQLKKPDSLIKYVKDRPGHDFRYAIDSSKIKKELNWDTKIEFENGLSSLIKQYQIVDNL
jgi:dTDP-glucose 4,6-dehydratase